MTFLLPQTVRNDRAAQILLGLSALFGLAYLFDDFGLGAPYPLDVAIKAAGILLLAGFALQQRHPVLALGLFLGAQGDIFLALQPAQLPLGIAAFGLGHLVYIYLFAMIRLRDGARGSWSRIGALALAAYGIVMLSWLQPYFGELRLAASIYNGIILVMAILAVLGRAPALALAGALLFVVSDSVLAVRLFADGLDWAGPVVWITYYLGQAGIAVGLASTARSA
ncbi:lysoplasmalogenase [Maricaulis sp.]|uniref:lysoplasmalogenase n=1 Tax=Maricaulis sp. TaxID=1486257 RepID=UPI002631DB91|nr:lysoplasmalogenase [Maricaulis sp.]